MSSKSLFEKGLNANQISSDISRPILDAASKIGHEKWLGEKGVVQLARRRPHPTRDFPIGDKAGNPFVVPFSLLIASRDEQNGKRATVTKEEFISQLNSAFGEEIDFSYINDLSNEEFSNWKKQLATDGIKNNEAWGYNSILILQALDINLSGGNPRLEIEDFVKLFSLKDKFTQLQSADTIDSVMSVLKDTDTLKALIIAHHNWRLQKGLSVILGDGELESMLNNSEAYFASGVNILSSEYRRIADVSEMSNFQNINMLEITKGCMNVIRFSESDSSRSFWSMVAILQKLGYEKYLAENSFNEVKVRQLSEAINWLIEEIKKDANLAPINAIINATLSHAEA